MKKPSSNKKCLEKRKCIICGKTFYVKLRKARSQRAGIGVRPRHAQTCSRECSNINGIKTRNGVRKKRG